MRVCLATLLIISSFQYIYNLQVLMDQAKLTFLNSTYVEWAKVFVKRYSRQSSVYYFHIEGKIKQTWGNNVTIHILFYEYLHNEFRRSFVEMHFKFCDMVNSDPYAGGLLKNAGFTCPAPPIEYHLMNMTIPAENFPNVWPFEKGQIRVEATAPDNGYMFKGYILATFKEEKITAKKQKH